METFDNISVTDQEIERVTGIKKSKYEYLAPPAALSLAKFLNDFRVLLTNPSELPLSFFFNIAIMAGLGALIKQESIDYVRAPKIIQIAQRNLREAKQFLIIDGDIYQAANQAQIKEQPEVLKEQFNNYIFYMTKSLEALSEIDSEKSQALRDEFHELRAEMNFRKYIVMQHIEKISQEEKTSIKYEAIQDWFAISSNSKYAPKAALRAFELMSNEDTLNKDFLKFFIRYAEENPKGAAKLLLEQNKEMMPIDICLKASVNDEAGVIEEPLSTGERMQHIKMTFCKYLHKQLAEGSIFKKSGFFSPSPEYKKLTQHLVLGMQAQSSEDASSHFNAVSSLLEEITDSMPTSASIVSSEKGHSVDDDLINIGDMKKEFSWLHAIYNINAVEETVANDNSFGRQHNQLNR